MGKSFFPVTGCLPVRRTRKRNAKLNIFDFLWTRWRLAADIRLITRPRCDCLYRRSTMKWMQPEVTVVSMCHKPKQTPCRSMFWGASFFRPLSTTWKCVSLISNFLQLVQFWARRLGLALKTSWPFTETVMLLNWPGNFKLTRCKLLICFAFSKIIDARWDVYCQI